MKQKHTVMKALFLVIVPCTLAMVITPAIAQSDKRQDSTLMNTFKIYVSKIQQHALVFGKCLAGNEQYSREEVQLARAKLTSALAITAIVVVGLWHFKPCKMAHAGNAAPKSKHLPTPAPAPAPQPDPPAAVPAPEPQSEASLARLKAELMERLEEQLNALGEKITSSEYLKFINQLQNKISNSPSREDLETQIDQLHRELERLENLNYSRQSWREWWSGFWQPAE